MSRSVTPDNFLDSKDVAEILGIKLRTAQLKIRELNEELKNKGLLTIKGKVSTKYFQKRYGCEVSK